VSGQDRLRLVGLADGDPWLPRTASGASRYLLGALARRYELVGAASVALSRAQRAAIAAATFNPDRDRWVGRFYWHRNLSIRAKSRNSARRIGQLGAEFDLAVQVYGLFQAQGAPYVAYIDNTMELSTRFWPGWVPGDPAAAIAYERRLYHGARHVFAVGTLMRDSVVEAYGVPAERVSVVGGGANFDTLPEIGARSHEPVILFVGREWERKGGDVLAAAFRRVRERVPGARLRVVGTDGAPDEPGIERVGTVDSRAELADLYAQAAVFCLPSRYEGYGFSISEAMAYGLPCVVTRVGALDEVVVDGETGIVCERDDADALAEALLRVLEDPDAGDRLGAASRRRVETHLNWDATVARMAPALAAAVQR
jgi:glycosyltransferase involved in cell wall biosynthesis